MDEVWTRIVENMADRVTGPMKFRLLLQPLMASIFAIRSGLADAGAGGRRISGRSLPMRRIAPR